MAAEVTIYFQDKSVSLTSENPCIIPAGPLIIQLSGSTLGEIRLDGRVPRVYSVGGDVRVIPADLSRSTGFHHLHIEPGYDYWFGTEDAKLRLDGIEQMLRFLADTGLAWTGQLLFSNGSALTDPHVAFGWLTRHADRSLGAAEAVCAHPRTEREIRLRITSAAGGRLSILGTLAFLRQNGPQAVEADDLGSLEYAGRRYSPRRVVARKATESSSTVANRRMAWLTFEIRRLVDRVLEAPLGPGPQERQRCLAWRQRTDNLMGHAPIATLANGTIAATLPVTPSAVELVDQRYWTIFEAVRSLQSELGWSVSQSPGDRYAFVDFADQIYQLFAVLAIAKTLECHPTSASIGATQPAFKGGLWELYYDTVIPSNVMRTWRSYSPTSDSPRPDLVLRRHSDNFVVLADVKYRNNRNRASESSLKELAAYMSSFGLSRALVIFPPGDRQTLRVNEISGQGQTLVELTVCPSAELLKFLSSELLPLLNRAAQRPPWRD